MSQFELLYVGNTNLLVCNVEKRPVIHSPLGDGVSGAALKLAVLNLRVIGNSATLIGQQPTGFKKWVAHLEQQGPTYLGSLTMSVPRERRR